ncbi:unnamed protein product [Didymodactylos carnosus]|uniref:C2H2-type domain-containing protein n=1 Tax=Didymodactylos carnosus TaxID=1234261 RepID=A0A8S2FU96_9BILA|nr:unnamed protein product [Didymodactylos carnosus]CAF4336776.1 unnamed protein product [Didymodactylos carnosus]
MAELRRHLIVHSSEQPYHCFNCDYRSKWKCDVKKHMRVCGHHGPVLVGRKAMQKVMESLGLVIGNTDKQQQAAAAAAAAVMMQMTKLNEQLQHHDLNEQEDNLEYTASEDEEDDDLVTGDHSKREWDETDTNNVSPPSIATDNSRTINEDRDESTAAAAISVNSQKKKHMKFPSSTSQTISNSNLRCRQCDHEANDLSDLLVHRKAHACTKNGTKTNTAVNVSSHYHNADTINSSKTSLSNDNSHINNDISHEQSDMEEENSNLSDESENDNTQLVEQHEIDSFDIHLCVLIH